MQNLPTKEALNLLYFNGKRTECRTLAIHGITQLVKLYAGRGGALNVNKLTHKVKLQFVQYIDTLYWVSRAYYSNLFTDKCIHTLGEVEFVTAHIKKVKLYEDEIFKKVHSKVLSSVEKLRANVYKVYITCLWTNTEGLYKDWAHLFENVDKQLGYIAPDGTTFVLTKDRQNADYFVIVWGTREKFTDEELSRTIFFRTEPCFPDRIHMGTGDEVKGEPIKFLKYYDYYDLRFPNCIENWLQSKPSALLANIGFEKDDSLKACISSVVSNKYVDPGHKYRIDLLRYMISNIGELRELGVESVLHIYGFDNKLCFPPEYYKGPLPERDKSVLMKYRYTLIAENHSIPGYMTEKIADGILSECLVFYWGCPNIEKYFPSIDGEPPYVVLPMNDAVASFGIIKLAVQEDWWSKKIHAIRKTKRLILTKFMMQHRIAQVIRENIDSKILGEDAMNLLRLALIERKSTYGIWHQNFPPEAGSSVSHAYGIWHHSFSTILYTGARYEELKEMITRRTENRVSFKYYEGLSDGIPDNTLLVQEFSNSPIVKNSDTIHHYTIGFTRFCIRNPSTITLPKTYVINLERRPDRIQKFNSHFPHGDTLESWGYERFNAVDGGKLKINGVFPAGIQHIFRNNDFCSKPSVIGCAMSHIKLWQKLVQDGENSSYIIYEDDVEFASNYKWKLYSLLQSITFDWDMLFLGHLMCYELQDSHRLESDELPKWEAMSKYINPNRTSWIGTASYIISKRGAEKLLKYIEKNGVGHGIDYLIQLQFPNLLRAYGVKPMLNFAEYESPLNPNINVDSDIQK